MATVIAVSSFVARGAVGLRAIVPALDRMGHHTIACPTILLSSHLGHPGATGTPVAPETLSAMCDALDANGWLGEVDAVLTGYLPSVGHVRFAEALIGRVRALRDDVLVFCDPVLGDNPGGLYVPQDVADAVRHRLVPLSTHVKPNAFELAFLSGLPVETPADAAAAARSIAVPVILASSIPAAGGSLANVIVAGDGIGQCIVAREPDVPHGTGDLLAAMFVAHCLGGEDAMTSAAFAAGAVASVVALSKGREELAVDGPMAWHEAPPLPLLGIAPG
jgi:pyridoxine kinase